MLKQQELLAEAIASYRRAMLFKPAGPKSTIISVWPCRPRETLPKQRPFSSGVKLRPGFAEAHTNLGNALREQGRLPEAMEHLRHAVQLKPEFAEGYYNLGHALQEQGQLRDAIASLRRALELKPDYAEAHNNLGVALKDQGQVPEAMESFQRLAGGAGRGLRPQQSPAHAPVSQRRNPRRAGPAHAEYERRHAAPLRAGWQPHENARDPQRRLRLGFLSPDFRRHPVAHFLIRALENLDRRPMRHGLLLRSTDRGRVDRAFSGGGHGLAPVAGESHERLANQIRADRIDILFDLAGHTAHNRLLVFARKPAPIQITWIGYEGTTGLEAIDYLLADRYVLRSGGASISRKVLRMPGGYLCYDPPAEAPPVGPLPAIADRARHLRQLQQPGQDHAARWSRPGRRSSADARAAADAEIRGLGDSVVRRRYQECLPPRGIEPQRLDLLPLGAYAEYLAAYDRGGHRVGPVSVLRRRSRPAKPCGWACR